MSLGRPSENGVSPGDTPLHHLVNGPGELCTSGILPIGYIASRAFVGVRLIRDVPAGEYPQCAQR